MIEMKPLKCSRLIEWQKTEFRQESRIWRSVVSKGGERSNKRRREMSLSREERMSFTVCNKTVLLDRLIEMGC